MRGDSAETVYRRSDSVRLRTFDDFHAALAYVPEGPALHWLNSSAWLVLEICDGRSYEEIRKTFAEVQPDRADSADALVRDCLESLEQKSIVFAEAV